jgi:hypothetical protein
MEQEALASLLHDLYVVGSVGPTQQLYTRSQELSVASPSAWQALYRTLTGETRHGNIERVHAIVRAAIRELRSQVHDLLVHITKAEGDKYERSSRLHDLTTNVAMLREGLTAVRSGLASLASTYKGDKHIEATIRVIDKTIESELDLTKRALAPRAEEPRDRKA